MSPAPGWRSPHPPPHSMGSGQGLFESVELAPEPLVGVRSFSMQGHGDDPRPLDEERRQPFRLEPLDAPGGPRLADPIRLEPDADGCMAEHLAKELVDPVLSQGELGMEADGALEVLLR